MASINGINNGSMAAMAHQHGNVYLMAAMSSIIKMTWRGNG